jgi:hypothetical protein
MSAQRYGRADVVTAPATVVVRPWRFVMHRIRLALLAAVLSAGLLAPGAVLAGGGPAPTESCVPGTVWEDLVSGVTYICIYDELYGGTRWEQLSDGQRGNEGWMYRSSSYGCAYGSVGITGVGGSGALSIVRTYRWPCQTAADRITQPSGELRARIVIQRYNGGWSTCRDSGYMYSSTVAAGWLANLGMGAVPDCGSGTYRAWGFGAFYQGSAWRGGASITPSLWLR